MVAWKDVGKESPGARERNIFEEGFPKPAMRV